MRRPLPETQDIDKRLQEAVKVGRLDHSDLRNEFAYCVIETRERGDKRSTRRRRTRLRSGKILDLRNSFLIECQIYDQSNKGARLRLVGDVSMPNRIRLYEDAPERVVDALVVWRKNREIGICFAPYGRGRPITKAQLAYLRGKYYAIGR